jgi:hypothetical protein
MKLKQLIHEDIRRQLREDAFKPFLNVTAFGRDSYEKLKQYVKQNVKQNKWEAVKGKRDYDDYWHITPPSGANIDQFAKEVEAEIRALDLRPIVDIQKSGVEIKDGDWRFSSRNGNASLTYKSKQVSNGEWDLDRYAYLMRHKSFSGDSLPFGDGQAVIDYFKKKGLKSNNEKDPWTSIYYD